MRKTNTEFYMKHLKVLVEWNWQWRFTCVCPIYMNFEFYFLEFPMGNCFWYNFRQLFISWAFKKYKKDCNILKIIFVQDFSPPKAETAQFTNGFHLHVKHFFNKSICGERENSKCTNVLQNLSLDITYTADKMYHCYLGYMSLPFATLAKVFLTVHAYHNTYTSWKSQECHGKDNVEV